MRKLLVCVGMMLVLANSVFPQHARFRAPRPKTTVDVARGKQQDPVVVPVPQLPAIGDRFDVIETDGHALVIRTPEGAYRSIDDLPPAVRNEISRSAILSSSMNSGHDRPSKTMAVFVVSDPSDAADNNLNDGVYSPPTLRSAIQNANKAGGSQTILFAPGITDIQPLSSLPGVTAALTIDGTVASGKVILDGSASTAQIGLSLSGTSTVTNMVFRSWSLVGLGLTAGAINSVVKKNEFTLNLIGLNINASGTSVGSDDDADRNYAYGNKQDGIDITNANHTSIVNNFCGTHDGTTASPNKYDGVYVLGNDNVVRKNVLSGNQLNGLEIGQFSNRTLIADNFIGVDFNGSGRLPNTTNGINTFGAKDTIVDNIISGNGYGITVLGQASQTYIAENTIGSNKTLDSLFGNSYGGLQILGSGVVIEGNLISCNNNSGVLLTGAGGTVVKANWIGSDPTGTKAWPNGGDGIYISSNKNIIGGQTPEDGNIVSGNLGSGIYMYGGTTFQLGGPSIPNYVRGNLIQNNYIGIKETGSGSLSNLYGIFTQGYVDSNIVRQNVISGNFSSGIWLSGSPTRNDLAQNIVGSDASGKVSLFNLGDGILITQAAVGNIVEANLVSGNLGNGVQIAAAFGKVPSGNSIIGNIIGMDIDKMFALSNTGNGVLLGGAVNTQIGGSTDDSSNVISGNLYNGVYIRGDTSRGNLIRGNFIGTSPNDVSIPNDRGILIAHSNGNTVGGSYYHGGNFISGNLHEGVYLYIADSNVVSNNIIGLDRLEGKTLSNGASGVVIDSANYNIIGGDLPLSANAIAGNDLSGVALTNGATGNQIFGNTIGTDYTGTKHFGNLWDGIQIANGAHRTTIGKPGAGNTIRFNWAAGVMVYGGDQNTISANSMYNNGELGIDLFQGGRGYTPNDNLDADDGANGLQNYPQPLLAEGPSPLRIFGEFHSKPNEKYRLEFFTVDTSDASGYVEGNTYIGYTDVTTNALGASVINALFPATFSLGTYVLSTATDSAGNTSEFSYSIPVVASVPYADIAITVTDSVHSAHRADTLVYLFTVQNNGPDTATQVVAKDTISRHVTFISDSASGGNATWANGALTYTIGSLAPGKKVNILLVVKADSAGSAIHKAYVSAHESDFNPGNNTAIDTTIISISSGVNDRTIDLPLTYELKQNYPNPFNPSTTIAFDMPSAGNVQLRIFDLLGREVASLLNEHRNAGRHHVEWDASRFSSGVYFYRIESGNFKQTKKLVFMK